MARYSIEITDGIGNPLEDYTATIVHHNAPNKVAESKAVNPTQGVPTLLEVDPKYTGTTLLYIMGPVPGSEPGAGENLSHFEPINLDHDGAFTFVVFHCPDSNTETTVVAAAAALPEDMTSILEKTEGTEPAVVASRPKVVELVCTPVRLHASRTVAPPHGYVCELHHHDMPRSLTVPVHVAPEAEVTLQVPSAQGAYYCHVYEADAAGGKGALLGSLRLTLRVGDRPYGATLLLTPARTPIKTFHTARIDPPDYTIQYRWPVNDHQDQDADSRVPHRYLDHIDSRQRSALARALWEECHAHAKREVLKLHPGATHFRVRALLSDPNTEYVLREVSGNYTWHAFHAGGSAYPRNRITGDLDIDGIIAEWVLES